MNNKSLIIVDDSPDFIESLRKILKLDGIEPKMYIHPEEFLVYADTVAFNECKILIVDYSMPNLTGYDVFKRLYEIMDNSIPIKMILYTANIEQIKIKEKEFLERIGVELIKKPNIRVLLQKITERIK